MASTGPGGPYLRSAIGRATLRVPCVVPPRTRTDKLQYVLVAAFASALAIVRPWADNGSSSFAFSLRRYIYALLCTCVPIVYVQMRLFQKKSSAAKLSCSVGVFILSFDVWCFAYSPVEELLAETDLYFEQNTVGVGAAFLVLGVGLPMEPMRHRHRLAVGVAVALLRGVGSLVVSWRISSASQLPQLQYWTGETQFDLFLSMFVGTAGVFLLGVMLGAGVVGTATARVEPQSTEGEALLPHRSHPPQQLLQQAGAQSESEPPAGAPRWVIAVLAAAHAVPFSLVAAACGAPLLPRDVSSAADWLRTALIAGGIVLSSLKIATLVCDVR